MKKFKLLFLGILLSAGMIGNLDASNKPRKAYTTEENSGYTVEDMKGIIKNFIFNYDGQKYKIIQYSNEARVNEQLGKIVKRKSRTGIDIQRNLEGINHKLAKDFIKLMPGLFREEVIFQNQGTKECHPGKIRVHGKKSTMTPKIEVMGFINIDVVVQNDEASKIGDEYTQSDFKDPKSKSEGKKTKSKRKRKPSTKRSAEDIADEDFEDADAYSPPKRDVPDVVTVDYYVPKQQGSDVQTQATYGAYVQNKEIIPVNIDREDDSSNGVEFNAEYVIKQIMESGLTVKGGEFAVYDSEDSIRSIVTKLFARKKKGRKWCKQIDAGSATDKAAKESIKLKRGVFRMKIDYVKDGITYDGILRINGISNGKSYGETGSGITYQYFIGEEQYKEWPKDSDIRAKSIELPENFATEDNFEANVDKIYGYLCGSNPMLNRILTLNDNSKHAVMAKIREKLKDGIYRWVKFPMLAQNAVLKKTTKDGRMVVADDKIPVTKFRKIGAGQDVIELSFTNKEDDSILYIYMHFKTKSGFKTGSSLKERLANKKAGKILQITLTKNKNYARGPVKNEGDEIEGQED